VIVCWFLTPGSFGASTIKVSNLNLGSVGTRFSLQPLHDTKFRLLTRFDALILSQRSENKALIGCRCLSSEAESTANLDDGCEEEDSSSTITQFMPNSVEVEYLLTEICDSTSVAEFELKTEGFRLYVKRDLTGQNETIHPPVSVPVSNTTTRAPDINGNGSASSLSLAVTKPVSASTRVRTLLDTAADEGLMILRAPTVGKFRRSRVIKRKIAPPACREHQKVKEGKVVCYIEQLGGQIPIESDISGEIIKILLEDGEPVGYGDPLIAILPSFPGIKKLK